MRSLHQQAEASLFSYGPQDDAPSAIQVVGTFGELGLEYASLRKHAVLLDMPHRGVIEVAGRDRLDFLNRMLTQELKKLPPFHARRSFWLNKKGRIDADVHVVDLPNRTLLEMDALAVRRTFEGLGGYIVSEDVLLRDVTESTHRLGLYGPTALALLTAVSMNTLGPEASGPAFGELAPGRVCVVAIAGVECVVWREDSCGEPGLELLVPAESALALYQHLIEAGHADEDVHGTERPSPWSPVARQVKLRPSGWHAFNIARLEHGTPIYNIDFGPESLLAETGVLNDRVSFTKGCYLGQEIVARMHARGQPKQMLVALRFERIPGAEGELPRQPFGGSELLVANATGELQPVGAITSSTLSPMLGQTPIALAQVRTAHATPGTVLVARAEGTDLKGVIQPTLTMWSRTSSSLKAT